jgi:molybdopterin converting factor small subunit
MEALKAFVRVDEEMYTLEIELGDEVAIIPLSQDQPNEVKEAFNKLIKRLKSGFFQVELQDGGEDLFSQVSKEYLVQLNRELGDVFGEMVSAGLSSVPEA